MGKHIQEPWPRFFDICQPSTPIPDSEPVALLGFDDYIMARACVNACAGMNTEHMENQAILGETLLDRFNLLKRESRKLTKQRDELLDAANATMAWWEEHQYDCDGDRNRYDDEPEFVTLARKATAKAKGGAA